MLFLTKRRVLCTHILEAYIFKDFNNRKIPLNINPLNYIISVEICSLQAIVLSYRRKIRTPKYTAREDTERRGADDPHP